MGEHGGVTAAPRSLYALAGLVAGLAGIAVSHAVTMLLTIRATPLLAVAEAIIEITPGPLAESLIQLAGEYDKPILIAGVTVVLLALSAWAGALTQRGQGLAVAVFVVMGGIGVAAVWTRPDATAYDVVPVVAGTVTWIVVLSLLVDQLTKQYREEEADHARRRFLLAAGVAAGAAVVVGLGGQVAGASRRSVDTARKLLRLPVARGVVPTGAEVELEGVQPWRTPNGDFYRIDTALVVPTVEPTDWRLRVHGMVERELVLTYQDLLDRELTEDWVTLCCVSNEVGGDLIGNAYWSGVRIANLLAEAGVDPDADAVRHMVSACREGPSFAQVTGLDEHPADDPVDLVRRVGVLRGSHRRRGSAKRGLETSQLRRSESTHRPRRVVGASEHRVRRHHQHGLGAVQGEGRSDPSQHPRPRDRPLLRHAGRAVSVRRPALAGAHRARGDREGGSRGHPGLAAR